MSACTPFDALCAERAAGAIAPADSLWLDAHLATCESCREALRDYELALGAARLPPPTDAERQPLAHLRTRVRAELGRPPVGKALGRLLGLGFAAAAVVVVVANQFVLPAARRGASPAAVAAASAWEEPDPDQLLRRIEREHPELAISSENGLVRAEELADAAYLKVVSAE